MVCASRYGNCLTTGCCTDAQFACFKRSGRLYAQCRPKNQKCGHGEQWSCPQYPSPPPAPLPPPPYPPAASVSVAWLSDNAQPFSIPFEVVGADGKLWAQSLELGSNSRQELHIKGANWFGFQNDGCVHELWKHQISDYIAFLTDHSFNAVRLPLSAPLVISNDFVGSNCGELKGMRMLSALDLVSQHGSNETAILCPKLKPKHAACAQDGTICQVVGRLRDAGIFVLLGIHTITEPEANTGLWCEHAADEEGCTPVTEEPLHEAWLVLAERYCSAPNVVFADLFNEPYLATWGTGKEVCPRQARLILDSSVSISRRSDSPMSQRQS